MISYLARSRRQIAFGACAFVFCLAVSIAIALGAEVSYALHIENGHVPENMRLIRVKQNDIVHLQWTADKPSIVHLHGYDIEKHVVPGAVTDLTFTARATGRFPVNLHGGEAGAGGHGHEDTLVTIEVYPQ